ncbi:hypothetical protein ACFL3V_03475 [Nanoarchaeota archaeon]
MKRAISIGIMLIVSAALLVSVLFNAGCDRKFNSNVSVSPETEVEVNPVTGQPPQDIVEKRGVVTNITEFNELMTRASRINSFKYTITDTDLGEDPYKVFVLGRFVKIMLPDLQQHNSGELFDEILMERRDRIAFSHCSKYNCDRDRELEKVEFDDYYIKDPMEYLYMTTQPEFLKEEMLGNDYTKVFGVKFEGKDGRIWLQEYYGYPLKIIVKEEDGSKRTIKFEEMFVDATRSGEIDTPANFTVKGEDGQWVFWKHYLGEWPPKGRVVQPGQSPLDAVNEIQENA